MRLVSPKEFISYHNITHSTLHRWAANGKVKFKRLSDKKILYDIDFLNESTQDNRINVIYARVSTTKQKSQLEDQISTIKSFMLNNGVKPDKIYKDIGSGLNCNRKNLNCLLQDVASNKIDTIYISFKDRLTRFGFDYFTNFCKLHGTNIVVLDDTVEFESNSELANDIISIIHHYSMKLYSNRRKKLKAIEKIILDDNY